MKLRFTALAIALAAASSFAARSSAQDSYQWRPAVGRSMSVADAPAAVPAGSAAMGSVAPASYAMPAASPYGLQPAAFASFGDEGYGPPVQSGYGPCSCGGTACGGCGGRGLLVDRFPVYGLWGSAEYVFAWAKGRSVPPLVTTSGVLDPTPGILPDATTLFGGERIGEDEQAAGRITLGVWLDPCQTIGIGVRGFAVEGATEGFFAESDLTGFPVLANPFFDVVAGEEGAIVIAQPGEFAGEVGIRTAQDVISADTFLRTMLVRGNGYSFDLIGGYHYAQVRDAVEIASLSTVISTTNIFPQGTTFDVLDNFSARNDFHGGEIGFLGELRHGCWRLKGLGKVSIGNMEQTVTISGRTITTVPPNTVDVDNNGLYAQTSNIGTFTRDETTFIPEAGLTLGYQVTRNVELTVGYSLLYWESVVLSGDAIDRRIDLTQAGGGPAGTLPEFTFQDTDFWVQGLNLGATWNF